jgi:hypothetical protein
MNRTANLTTKDKIDQQTSKRISINLHELLVTIKLEENSDILTNNKDDKPVLQNQRFITSWVKRGRNFANLDQKSSKMVKVGQNRYRLRLNEHKPILMLKSILNYFLREYKNILYIFTTQFHTKLTQSLPANPVYWHMSLLD